MSPPCRPPRRPRGRRRHQPRRLRKQLFLGFGVAILVTMLVSGLVTALFHPTGPPKPWARILAFAAAGNVLWMFSGALAHWLAWPLWELLLAVRGFGAGKLDSRARVPRRAAREVVELASEFNEMAGRIQVQVEQQRELLGAVSHELRTPLSRMRVLLALLQDRGSNTELLAKFEREIVEIDALVGELLAEARIQAGALNRREVDVADMARECGERLGIELAALPSDARVRADPTLLSRALTLLLDNARKHGGERIGLYAQRSGDSLRVWVEDDGLGFEPADLPRLFTPFARGSGKAAEDDGRGVGLGLYLVRRIAEAHAGGVFAENRAQGGARVGFTLLDA